MRKTQIVGHCRVFSYSTTHLVGLKFRHLRANAQAEKSLQQHGLHFSGPDLSHDFANECTSQTLILFEKSRTNSVHKNSHELFSAQ
jgi:hypothetical protein